MTPLAFKSSVRMIISLVTYASLRILSLKSLLMFGTIHLIAMTKNPTKFYKKSIFNDWTFFYQNQDLKHVEIEAFEQLSMKYSLPKFKF